MRMVVESSVLLTYGATGIFALMELLQSEPSSGSVLKGLDISMELLLIQAVELMLVRLCHILA